MPSSPYSFSSLVPARTTIIVLHDMGVVMLALPVALMLRENAWPSAGRLEAIALAMPLLALSALIAALMVSVHRGVWRYISIGDIGRIGRFAALTLAVFYIAQFGIDRLAWAPRSLPIIHFLVAAFLLVLARMIYAELCRRGPRAGSRAAHMGSPRERLLLIGSGDGAALVLQLLRHRSRPDEEVIGVLANGYDKSRHIDGIPVLGGLDAFDRVLETLRVQEMAPNRIVITCPHHLLGREAVYRMISQANAAGIEVVELPELVRLRNEPEDSAAQNDPIVAGDGSAPLYPLVKRGLEAAISGVALVLLAPLLALVAVAVAIFIQPPVLFVQVRPGQHRRPFVLYKFRSMRDPLDADGRRLSDLERTPWLGRLLRRTRIDELPQLWNVFVGDMSFIGPRPLLARDLDDLPDRGAIRSQLRPGLTGWAQVNGGHQLTTEEKLELDLWYAANANLMLDVRILLQTLRMMAMGEERNPQAIAQARRSSVLAANA